MILSIINIINGREIKKYCDDLYFDFFSYLNQINNTTNIDVQKSILNILTEIFISKITYRKLLINKTLLIPHLKVFKNYN